jgi:hypothetical protein
VSVAYINLFQIESGSGRNNPGKEDTSGSTAVLEYDERPVLCPYFWNYQAFELTKGYQEQIPNPAHFDLVICILWSRVGTELSPQFKLPDGSRPRSGTEYEIGWALDQAKKTGGIPVLRVYRKVGPPPIGSISRDEDEAQLSPKERLKLLENSHRQAEESIRQYGLLTEFIEKWETNSEGHLIGALNNYRTLGQFEELFAVHFRDFLASRLDEIARKALTKRVRYWSGNPFRGLYAFDFEHSAIFHGRTAARDEAIEALNIQTREGRPFLLVLGSSGSGKSSLVRAGILPMLIVPGSVGKIGLWRRAVMRPAAKGTTGDPFEALAAELLEKNALPEVVDAENSDPVADLAYGLRENPEAVTQRIRDTLDAVASKWKLEKAQALAKYEAEMQTARRFADAEQAHDQRERLVEPRAGLALVVDQLEELFSGGFLGTPRTVSSRRSPV